VGANSRRIAELTPTFATTTSRPSLAVLCTMVVCVLTVMLQFESEVGAIYRGLNSNEDGNIKAKQGGRGLPRWQSISPLTTCGTRHRRVSSMRVSMIVVSNRDRMDRARDRESPAVVRLVKQPRSTLISRTRILVYGLFKSPQIVARATSASDSGPMAEPPVNNASRLERSFEKCVSLTWITLMSLSSGIGIAHALAFGFRRKLKTRKQAREPINCRGGAPASPDSGCILWSLGRHTLVTWVLYVFLLSISQVAAYSSCRFLGKGTQFFNSPGFPCFHWLSGLFLAVEQLLETNSPDY
jgi:hypothetical protein